MLIEFYLLFTVIGGLFSEISKSEQVKKTYLKLVFIIAFIIAGFRGENVGCDTLSYHFIYERIRELGITELPRNTELEKGFMILCWILGKISSSPQILFVVSSGVISYSFYKIINDYSKDYMLSSVIFVSTIFTITMNVMRQYLALTLLFLSIKYTIDKKKNASIIFLLLAISMHYSAILFLPIWLLSFKKINMSSKMLLAVSLGMIMIIPLFSVVLNWTIKLFPQYNRFLESERYSGASVISIKMMLYFIVIMIFSISGLKKTTKQDGGSQHDNALELTREDTIYYLFICLFVGYIVTYIISTKMLIAGRLVYYFQASQIILIPNMIYKLNEGKFSKYKIIIHSIIVVYFVINGFNYIQADPHRVLPYIPFWQG